jgi:AhpD family alkylhydroperoxidase
MALTTTEKELANIGASVATGCKPCTDYHFGKLRKLGASNEQIEQAIADALIVRDHAREIMESHGLSRLGVARHLDDGGAAAGTTRIKELVSVAAAFAVNCTTSLKDHIAAAKGLGVNDEEIRSVLDAAQFIKGEAAHYVEQIVELSHRNVELQELLEELQRTQAQLVQSEKMAALGKLVAGVVHEMNTPLGTLNACLDVTARSVSGILAVLEGHRPSEADGNDERLQGPVQALRDVAPVSEQASRRISELIGNLKSFARLDEEGLQSVDLHQGLDNTLALLEPDLRGSIHVAKQYGRIPAVVCYPAELNQVWMNLFLNARQAIRGEGTITVRTACDTDNVRIEIADTGIGILPERIAHLFDPRFSRGGGRVKAGMGLFISYNIVQKHRGRIEVTSQLGRGSSFTVSLPRDFRELPPAKEDVPVSNTGEARCERIVG